jgi:hypothetical protein
MITWLQKSEGQAAECHQLKSGSRSASNHAPDCLQRPLLRRSRFRQQVSASVGRLEFDLTVLSRDG